MAESHALGQKGEKLAAEHLRSKGYKILHTNWKSGKYELDIVAENSEFLIFAEVKTRSDDFMSAPSVTVTRDKQRLILFAAESYIKRFNVNKESRFDIISVISRGEKFEIEHIENAFYPTLR